MQISKAGIYNTPPTYQLVAIVLPSNTTTRVVRILSHYCRTNCWTNLMVLKTLSPQGWRRMVGCYIGMDEANSEARMKGF